MELASQINNETLGQTLIPVINKLQDIFSQVSPDVRLDLPQVAVVGSQSSGKSSVLEALVGRDFLPRGSSIVTRRPLILQLVKAPPASGQYPEWGEFLHCQGKRFYDFDRIRHEILAETDRGAGSNKDISEKPIRLRIFSPHVLNMTLVDLPGLTRVPVGDQPPDIEARLRRLIMDYISSPSCVILAVSPANQDLASSDALHMARQADPEGVRTVGVLTKLDIMDRGTDGAAAMRNEVVPLRLGYVGVVLRSQEDIASRRSMAESRAAERAFFESRPEYASVAGCCGVGTLARTLNVLLVDHIRDGLPTLRARIEEAAAARRRELRMYGDAPPGSTSAARGAALLTMLDCYATRFAAALDGNGEHLPVSELAGGARIRHIFQEIFNSGLDALQATAELTDEDVRTAIKNSGGIKGSLLIPEAPFELLVRRAIDRLLPPALQCKEFVHTELLRIASQCAPPDVSRFPVLQTVLVEAVEDFINNGAGPAEHMIRNLVACELAYINTSHPQFIGGNRAIAQVLERRGAADAADDGSDGDDLLTTRHRQAGQAGGVQMNGLAAAAKLSMKGVEPELFRPEELLSGREREREGGAGTSGRPGLAGVQEGAGGEGAGGRNGWLSGWFNRGTGAEADGAGEPPESVLKRPPPTLRVPKAVSDQEGVQVEVTRVLVDSYFDIVRKNLQDAVPKALMHFLVNSVRRGLQQHLIRTLYREELFAEIMGEREDVAAKRHQCQEALVTLRSALKTLEALPGELVGRVNASSARVSFKQMLAQVDERGGGEGGGPSSRSHSRNASPTRVRRERDPTAASGATVGAAQLSAAQKAALSAVSMLGGAGGNIGAYRKK